MKLFYWNHVALEGSIGVAKKIKSQLSSFERQGMDVYWSCAKENELFFYHKKNRVHSIIFNKVEKHTSCLIRVTDFILENNFSILYIRKSFHFTLYFISSLRRIKKKHPNIKIVLEIPTYPYKGELKSSIIGYSFYTLEKISTPYLKKYIDKIITFSDHKSIWGIPCLNIKNGIGSYSISPIAKAPHNGINLTVVAAISVWHGIDRLLISLNHYKIENIAFTIVGEGSVAIMEELYNIVNSSDYLAKIVTFSGKLEGSSLNPIYENTDIAVGSLAIHRIGLKSVQTLKNVEYTAKGIPFIYAFEDNNFGNLPFTYKVNADESIINIPEILDWYSEIKITSEEISRYAKNYTWDNQMNEVIKSLNI